MTALAAAGATALAVSVGCSTFETEEPALTEAGPDQAAPDVQPVIDGATPPDGARLPFCQSTDAAFCADFEQGALDVGFNPSAFYFGGQLDLEEVEGGVPSPRILRATTYAFDAAFPAEGYAALLAKDLLREEASGIRLELDVRIDLLPPGSFLVVSGLETKLGSAKNTASIAFESANGYLLVENRAPFDAGNRYIFPLPAARAWTHVRVDFNLLNGTITLYTNGDARILDAIRISGDALAVTATVGIVAIPPTATPAQVGIDNVVLQRF